MLRLVYRLQGLNFAELMDVYEEGNRENGAEFYPELPQAQQLLRAEQDFYQYLQEGFFNRLGDVYCLWVPERACVAALRLQTYRDGLLLEALETAPKQRRKGHASALVQAVQKEFPGRKIYVHISKQNHPSIALHEGCGFRRISDSAVYADGSVTNRANTYLYFREQ